MPEPIFRFAEALRSLLSLPTPESFERRWDALAPEEVGWDALARAWRRDQWYWERALGEVDGLLLRLLARLPVLTSRRGNVSDRVRVFRGAELERLQHATAAALVAQRFGVAGLRTVVDDRRAPVARRYFAFFALAERHPPRLWPCFAKYLSPAAHHAFAGVAAEAARFYPDRGTASSLVRLFDQVRGDLNLRAFLGPRILESLFVLGDPDSLPLFQNLLTVGHTHAQPESCEVMRALVMVKRFTGAIAPNVKYSDVGSAEAADAVRRAEARYVEQQARLRPVHVI